MYTVSKLLLNSLYGRLGMSPYVENHIVIESEKSNELLLNEDYTVTNVVDLQNGKELISYFNKKDIKAIDDGSKSKNISIVIAAAVTAYARIKMSEIKMDNNIKIYYSDTDSFVVDKLLNNNLVSEKLGDFKLENIFTRAAFLAPKVYGGLLKDQFDKQGNPIEKVKIKGLKKTIKFEEFVTLLKKDSSLKKPQEKFYRDLANGRILVDNSDYTLIVTGNKRKIIYENGVFTKTKPLNFLYDKIVD
jgi:DNA polymerase type B, organellar and viral